MGTPRDPEAAASYWQKAARAYSGIAEENPYAAFSLALLYRTGHGVARDPAQEAHWLTRAADLGHPNAKAQLQRAAN